MDFIQCQRHEGSKINLIYFENDKTQLICEQCLDDYLIKEQNLNTYQILSIQKIINQPHYLIQKLKINKEIQKFCEDLVKNNQNSVSEKINDLEKQLKLIQDKLMQMLQELQIFIKEISELNQTLIGDISKILDCDQLKKILLGLTQKKDDINPDVEQIQQQLNHYFKTLFQNTSSNLQKDLFVKSKEILGKVEQEISKLVDHDQLSQLQTKFYEDQLQVAENIFPKLQIKILENSNLIFNTFRAKLQNTIERRTKKKITQSNLIYLGTRDGLTAKQYWSKINDKSNLLMIFKSKSNYVFGGYTPCQWQMNLNDYVQDNSLSSFLFSQTHKEIYPLKKEKKQYAIYCSKLYGPIFGGGCDIYMQPDFQDGFSYLGHNYQWNESKGSISKYLFGQFTPSIIEHEIYEIIFN